MQVVNELIGQLRSKGLLSDALLHELQELGFDKDVHPEFDDDYLEEFEWDEEAHLAAMAAMAAEEVELTLTERRASKRGDAVQGSRDERLVTALEVHEWPQPLLELLDDAGRHVASPLRGAFLERLIGADEEALDLAVRAIATAYPGALTKMWTALTIDPLPSGLQQAAGPEAGLFEVLLEADKDVATALRYKSSLANDAVRRAIRIVRAHRRLLASFGRLLVAMSDGEMGWHLQFNTDPLLLEVAIILYSARQPRLTVGELLKDDRVSLAAPTLLPDDPFVHGWQFAAMADPIRVLPLMRWCHDHWDDHDLTRQARHGTVGVMVRLRSEVLASGTESRFRELPKGGFEAWLDARSAQQPRILALVWAGARWSRLTIALRDPVDSHRAELVVDDTAWEVSMFRDGPPLSALSDLSPGHNLAGTLGPHAYIRITKPGSWRPPLERWDVGTQFGRGLHDFPVLRCAPEWSQPSATRTPRSSSI